MEKLIFQITWNMPVTVKITILLSRLQTDNRPLLYDIKPEIDYQFHIVEIVLVTTVNIP